MNCYYNVKYFPVYTIFSTLEEFKAATLEGKLNASALLNNNTRAYCIDSGLDVRGDEKVGDECTFYAGLARFDITQPFEGSYYSDYDDKDPEEFVSTEIASVHHFRMESPFPAVEDLANWQGLTFRRRRCQILFCAKHHTNTSISRGEFTSQEHSIDLKFSRACDNEDCEYSNGITHEGDSPIFRVNTKARAKFGVALAEVMRGIIVMPLSLSYLKQTTIEEFADMVCTVVDSFLKSEHNRNSTTIRGSALGSETYIHVRWQWVVYPLSVVLASAVFLVLTIFESRRKEQRYKSSVLAGYFNRLVGFDNDEIKEIERRALDQKSKKETFHNLERMAAELPVKLRRNSEGEIELVKI